MFTWICPKCGGEVPPSYNECPRCSGQTASPAAGQPAAPPPPSPSVGQQAGTAAPPLAPAAVPPVAPPAVQSRTLSPAVVAIGATVVIAGLLAALYFWVLPRRSGAAEAAPAKAEPVAAQTRHPLAKHLELVGVRIVESGSGSAKIQFLVVNHSAADLPEMKMDVTLRAADREVFAFPVTLPSIGPYEYKELTSTVRTDLKPYELPDWQVIRPEFRLTTEP